MKTFNSFITKVTLVSAMAIALLSFQATSFAEEAATNAMANKDAMADTNTNSNHMMDKDNSAMPSDNQVPMPTESDKSSMETMPKDDTKMPADTDKTMTTTTTTTDTDTEKTSTDTSSTDDTTPWYKKWLAKLGM